MKFQSAYVNSLIKTKHKAVTAQMEINSLTVATRKIANVYDKRQQNIDKLRYYIGNYDWNDILNNSTNITEIYTRFLNALSNLIDQSIPKKVVRLGPRDPEYFTPLIKHLLISRNRLMRRGNLIKANEISVRLGQLIREARSTHMNKLAGADTKRLWQAVNGKRSTGQDGICCKVGTPDDFNDYFANIATDSDYNLSNVENMRLDTPLEFDFCTHSPPEPYFIEQMLYSIDSASSGPYSPPCWVLKQCSYELAEPVCQIIKLSLSAGQLPAQWLTSFVTPVPKVPQPKTFNDFRPISVTPILCRLTEKLLVKRWLQPAIDPFDICDQFAFRPTGSTTVALTFGLHHITRLLENNKYVRCFLIDFRKAFDTVNHQILLNKIKRLKLPHFVFNWILNFLTGRSQVVKFSDILSSPRSINRGIIQGSGLGPTLYIIMESNLHPMSYPQNLMFKFADDTTLLVPQNTTMSAKAEILNIKSWAFENKMEINWKKTTELVFRQPNFNLSLLPKPICDIQQVKETRLLGVILSGNLNFTSHINYLLSVCSQRLYLLKQLKNQGLSQTQLNIVYTAIITSRLNYALSSWAGFISCEQKNKINSLLKKSYKFGYMTFINTFDNLIEDSDYTLFKNLSKKNHCAHFLLPPFKSTSHSLRSRGHQLTLPKCAGTYYKKSFICRYLYNTVKPRKNKRKS